MQSVVFGATGVVGRHIVNQLVLSGERPFAVSRSPRQDTRNVEWFVGDLADWGRLRFPPFSTIYCTVHPGLLAAALRHLHHAELRQVVLFTSTSILTKINSEIPAESELLQGLAQGERDTIACCEELGIAWTVLRPTIIYDEGRDANISRLAGLIRRLGFLPLAGRGLGLRQPVHAEDLAIGAVRAAASEAAANKIYALPGSETITYREMAGRIFDGLGKPRIIVPVPPLLWKVAFTLAQPLFPNANVAMGMRMAKDMVFDGSAARQDFGWNPRGFRPRFAGD
jgi:uncharacterized protein YbjT (DUF2867 family)